MRYALYGKSNRWFRRAKQEIDGIGPLKDCVYGSVESALEDSKNFGEWITQIKIKNLDTKEIVYQGNRP